MPILLTAVTLLGLAVGSFLNVVIHRLPARRVALAPGLALPGLRRGRPRPAQRPGARLADAARPVRRLPRPRSARATSVVELVTAALFVATTVEVARLHLLAALPAYLFFVAAGIALAAIDLDVMRLPNAIVYPSYGVLAVLLTAASLVERHRPSRCCGPRSAPSRCSSSSSPWLSPSPAGMGLGDVKLAGAHRRGARLPVLPRACSSARSPPSCSAASLGGGAAARAARRPQDPACRSARP